MALVGDRIRAIREPSTQLIKHSNLRDYRLGRVGGIWAQITRGIESEAGAISNQFTISCSFFGLCFTVGIGWRLAATVSDDSMCPSRKEAGRGRISGLSVVRCGMVILPMSGELFEPRARRPCHFRQHSRTTDNPEVRQDAGEFAKRPLVGRLPTVTGSKEVIAKHKTHASSRHWRDRHHRPGSS